MKPLLYSDSVRAVIESFREKFETIGFKLTHLIHEKRDVKEINVAPIFIDLAHIANHYKWAIDIIVKVNDKKNVIILEDDLVIFSFL